MDKMDEIKLFTSIENSYHVPSMYLMNRYLDKSLIGNKGLVYHPWSQTLMEVEKVYSIIYKLYELGYTIDEISSILDLPKNDILEALRELEEMITKLKPAEVIEFNRPTILMLLSDLRCNLRCKYCYTQSGQFFFNRLSHKMVMSKEVVARSIDLGAELGIGQVEIFGGGEPLLNKEIVEYVLRYIDSKKYPMVVAMITNGTLIDDKFVEIVESYKDMFTLTISIDGPKLVHDLNRVYPSGKGSFNDVIKGIEKIKNAGITFELQSTYPIDAYKLGYAPKDIAYYLSQFSKYVVIKFADYNRQFGAGIDPLDGILGHLFIEYVNAALSELSKDSPKFCDQNVALSLTFIARKAAKRYPCPFTHFVTVLPNGLLLTCHMVSDIVLGHISDSAKEIMNRYKLMVEYNKIYGEKLDYRDFWYTSIQDICPAELFGGLSKLLTYNKGKIRLDMFAKSIMESYWDSLLINVYKYSKKGLLQKIYGNLEPLFEEFGKLPRYRDIEETRRS